RQAFFLAVLGEEAHALAPALRRRVRSLVRAETDAAVPHRRQPEDAAQQARASRAEQSRDPEHLAATQRQAGRTRAEVLQLQERLARLARRARVELVDRAADHQR